jgi:hypothetical protein
MVRRGRFHLVEHKDELEVEWLLAPECAVVVEDGDSLRLGHEVGRALSRDRADELDDRCLGRPFLP